MADSLVIIPTYNERENIVRMVKAVLSLEFPFDLLVVDDSSPDGTADLVRGMLAEFPGRLHVEVRTGKRGLGEAYLHGFRWALARSYAYIFEMDADFSHAPSDLVRLRAACADGADVAIGSRYVSGGSVSNWTTDRRLLSSTASRYVRLVLGLPVRDTTAGFKCYRRQVLERIDLSRVKSTGYAFQIEMKYAAHRRGFSLVEIPITFVDRVAGDSKMSMKIFKEALWGVMAMRWRR